MKFVIDRASDSKPEYLEKEFNTLEELIDFMREVKEDIILWFEEERVKDYKAAEERWYRVSSDVEWKETGRIRLTIYDDYIE